MCLRFFFSVAVANDGLLPVIPIQRYETGGGFANAAVTILYFC